MNLSNADLWSRLEAFALDQAGIALPFSARLARENNWKSSYARRVVEEYKRFLYLAQAAGHPVTPPEAVDQAWHLHLVYTRSYWEELCGKVLRVPFHHGPTLGGPAEGTKFRDWYGKTLGSYTREFGEAPPADIWPSSEGRWKEQAARWRWVDRTRHWVLPKRAAALATAVVIGFMAAMSALTAPASPVVTTLGLPQFAASFLPVLDWRGPEFLAFYLGMLMVTLILSFRLVAGVRAEASRRALEPVNPDPYEVAWLNGEKGRVSLAVVSTLMERGLFTIEKAGHLTVSGQPVPPHLLPVEQTAYDLVEKAGTIPRIAFDKALDEALLPMRQKMEEKGLLMSESQMKRARGVAMWPLLLTLAIGAMKFFVGLSRDRPVGFLVILLIITMIILVMRTIGLSRATAAGLRLLKSLRETHHAAAKQKFSMSGSGASPDQPMEVMPLAVALFGLSVLDRQAYGSVHSMYAGSSGGGDSSSSGDSGGSSDGGGGGCGGCGGCGGGGD